MLERGGCGGWVGGLEGVKRKNCSHVISAISWPTPKFALPMRTLLSYQFRSFAPTINLNLRNLGISWILWRQ